ncbi:hypothetical protein [Leucobacter soli]|uniref:hypothetical protein n=1 Tax=Leucobacter soli TaxID=2812850 RepID=UPI003608DD65
MTSAASDSDRTADLEHLERLLARGIKVIRVIHPDLFGRQRGKQYPASALDSVLGGVAYSKMSVAEDLFGVPVDETEFPSWPDTRTSTRRSIPLRHWSRRGSPTRSG